jgi:spore coat polysaccharide biosynthesis protein SpsF
MGVGQSNRIAFVIQARMHSSRLPGKILLPLPLYGKKPVIGWIVDQLKTSRYMNHLWVVTSQKAENDVLEGFCRANEIACHRGKEEDVLSRFIQVCRVEKYDHVVRLTADNPVVDTMILDQALDFHVQAGNDYTFTSRLPLGMNFEIVGAKALIGLDRQDLSYQDREHVTKFIRNGSQYIKSEFVPDLEVEIQDFRLTIDYPSDYLLASTLFSLKLEKPKYRNLDGIQWIEAVNRDYPFVFKANRENIQKKQWANNEEERQYAVKLLESLELFYSADRLKTN